MFYMECKKVSGGVLLRAVSRYTVFRADTKLIEVSACLFRADTIFFRRECVFFRAATKFIVEHVCFYLGISQSLSPCDRAFPPGCCKVTRCAFVLFFSGFYKISRGAYVLPLSGCCKLFRRAVLPQVSRCACTLFSGLLQMSVAMLACF